jgi:sulfite exporter TauE/SafE
MNPVELSLMFSFGLVGGLHCLQMCGPIVLAYSLPLARRQAWRAHLAYNSGRILTYTALGALAGGAGGALGIVARMGGLATGARVLAGAAMIVAAILMIGLAPSNGLVQIQSRGWGAALSRRVGRLLLSPRKFLLGLSLGFLPCGLIYAALLKAMESASILAGAATMLSFGLGTSAALFAAGTASAFAAPKLGRWGTRLAPVFVALAGVILLWRGLSGHHHHG